MIELLDYILDNEDNFWVVNSIENNIVKGYIIYRQDDNGNRYNNLLNKKYTKCQNKGLIPIPKKYKQIFKPQEFYKNNKNNLQGIWKDYVIALNNCGIEDKNTGIFGSYLIGFDIIKDIDFIIYGYDNLIKYYNNIVLIRKSINVTYITAEHIEYQYQKFKKFYSPNTDLKRIISRNWSGIQIKKGVLSTPRFIIKEKCNIPKDNKLRKKIIVKVIDGLTTALFPRRAKVLYKIQEYELICPLWKYESFLKTGDEIECLANVDENNKIIILYDKDCYVKFLN